MLELPPKWLRYVFLGLFFASVLVTWLIVSVSSHDDEYLDEGTAVMDPADARKSGGQAISSMELNNPLSLRDFVIPDAFEGEQGRGFYPFRERQTAWGAEQVRRYWIPLKEIAADILSRKADEEVEKLFRDIP